MPEPVELLYSNRVPWQIWTEALSLHRLGVTLYQAIERHGYALDRSDWIIEKVIVLENEQHAVEREELEAIRRRAPQGTQPGHGEKP